MNGLSREERARTLGNAVRKRRRGLALSQEQLAERAGISVRTLISLESAAGANARPATLAAVGAALGLTGDELERFAAGLDEHAVRLPPEATPLVGRQAEIGDVLALFDGETRAVALVGPAGVGKSRVAAAVARASRERYDDGVCFVPLGHARDEDDVVTAIGDAVDLRLSGIERAVPSLVRALGRTTFLLVLDGMDGVRDADQIVARFLIGMPGVRVLATVRRRGWLTNAVEYPLSPLALPSPEAFGDVERVAASPAVQFFAARARAIDASFAIDARTAPYVAACASALDGLPLAIELAVPYLRIHTLERLADRLERTAALVIDRDDANAASSLRRTLELTYATLDDGARRLLAAAAVFRSGASVEAIAAVLEIDVARAELALLAAVERGLVVLEESAVRVLYVVREFALSQLSAAEIAMLRSRHARYYLGLVERDGFASAPLAFLAECMENLDAAFESAIDARDGELALRLALTTGRFARAARTRRGLRQLDRALELASDAATAAPALVARATFVAAFLRFEVVDHARALELFDRAEHAFAALGAETDARTAGLFAALIRFARGEREPARTTIVEAARAFEASGDERHLATAMSCEAATLELDGRFDDAVALLMRVLAMAERRGSETERAQAHLAIARNALALDDRSTARAHLDAGLTLRRDAADRRALAQALALAGLLEERDDNATAAVAALTEAASLNRLVQNGNIEAEVMIVCAKIASAAGATEEAAALVACYRRRHTATLIEPLWQRELAALELAADAESSSTSGDVDTLIEAALGRARL